MKYNLLKYGLLLVMLHTLAFSSFSQGLSSNYGNFTPCSGPIGLYTFDFTSTVNNSITQANISIQNSFNQCCSEPNNAGCIFFNVIVDPNAIGVVFQQTGAGGNVSIYYDNCATVFPANTNICLDPANAYVDPVTGQTYHRFMFCRSGQTTYDFTFNQLVAPTASPDIVTAIGCNQTLQVSGLTNPIWTSVSPGTTGQYNNLLSCTSCSTTVYTPTIGTPQTLIYQVSGTISSPCAATVNWSDQVSVTTYPTLFASPGPNVSICNGSVSGTIVSATAIGGTAPYTYSWTGPNGFTDINTTNNTTDNITVLEAGVYTVVISDGTGCPAATTSVTVTSFNTDIVANAGLDQTVCGAPAPIVSINGTVAATGTGIWSGGNGNYNSSTTDLTLLYTPSAAEITSGSVTLTLTPTNTGGCPFTTDQMTINLVQFTGSVSSITDNVSCFGLSDGSIDLSVNGGAPISTFNWSPNGQLTQDISGISAGSYSVLVTDINGCSQTSNFTISQPTVLSGLNVGQTNVSCFGGNNGTVTVAGAGGTPNYTYSLGGGSPQSSGTFSGLSAGSYTVTISDAENCQATLTVVITEPAPLSVALDNQTNILCFGGTTGVINITAAGDTPTYTYSWTGPNGFVSAAEDLTGLAAGTYNLTVTDANGTTGGCLATLSVTLTEPLAPLSVALDNQTNILCFGGTTGVINITAAGGTPTYTYSWTGPNGFVSAAEDLTGLAAGTYNLTVTDANGTTGGCLATLSVTLTEPLAPVSVTESHVDVFCFGDATGSINITAAGGTPTYTYSWTGPNGFTSTSEDLSSLLAGTYNLTLNDVNGTAGGCSTTLSVVIDQPLTGLTATETHVNVSCFGGNNGSIDLTPQGGTPPYTYDWSNDGTGDFDDPQDLSNLTAGTYTVVVNDVTSAAGNCQATLTVVITEQAPLSVALDNQTNILCFGGTTGVINITAAGGTPTYTYSWTGPNGFVSAAEDLTGLAAGTYNLTVTDANGTTGGCLATLSVTLTEPLAPLSVALDNQTNILCFGGTTGVINITAAGGTPTYTYSWTGPNGFVSTAEDLTGLAAGTYNLTVTDANGTTGGCLATLSVTLTEPLAPLSVALDNQTNILCFGGTTGVINITAAGGTPTYTYSWTGPNSFVSAAADLTGLAAGTYNLTVTDANGTTGGCLATLSVTLTEPLAPLSVALDNQTNILCFGGTTGVINITAAGGTPTYTYSWTGPNGFVSAAADLTGLAAGTYNLTVTDANGTTGGCLATLSVTLTEPLAPVSVTESHVDVFCFGDATGSINVTAAGGTPTYTYSWTGPNGFTSTTEDLTGLVAGTYNLTVNDANGTAGGCSTTLSVVIDQPLTGLTVTETHVNVSCFGGNNGSINLTPQGGTPPYTYDWSNDGTGDFDDPQDLSNLTAGTYTVVVNDVTSAAGNCQATLTVVITEPAPLSVALDNQTNILCFGGTTGVINITAAGGTPTYTYSWTGPNGFVSAAEDLTGLAAGTYNLTVTDANGTTGGCLATLSVTLTEPLAPLSVALDNQTNILCFGGTTGVINITAAGGTPTYTYSWTGPNGFVSAAEDLTGLAAGTYNLTVTDANGTTGGCLAGLTVSITQPQAVLPIATVVSNYNGEDISCFGASDGVVSVSVSGGNPNYIYEWFDPAGISIGFSQTQSGLSSGTYTVKVTDQNGCQNQTTVTVTEPPGFTYTLSVSSDYNGEDISCYGASDGSIDLVFSGGTPTYSYTWTNSSNSIVSSVEDPNSLPAGSYEVEVTDINGCSFDTIITLNQPDQLGAIASVTSDFNGEQVSCYQSTDGSLTVNVIGGIPTYTYSWTNSSGGQIGTLVDQNNVGAGNYTVQITDLNGCQITVGTTVSEPSQVTSSAQVTSNYFGQAVSCEGETDGSVDATAGGGVPGYTYTWNTIPIQTGSQLTNLGVGSYAVTVTDLNGCTSTSQVTLTANPLPIINLPFGIDECIYNSVILQASAEPGGTAVWAFSDGQTFTGFGPHQYNYTGNGCTDLLYTVTNAQGCTNQQLFDDYLCPLPSPNASFTHDPLEINMFDNGVNFTNTSSGASDYLWIFGDGSPNETIENPYHEYIATDDFNELSYEITLIAYSIDGCVDTALSYVTLNPDLIYYIPNAFTPDGDDHNGLFKPVFSTGFSVDKYSFMIFNRWGELIFETQEIGAGWDGTYKGIPSQEGVYTWKIQFMKSNNASKQMEVGHVTLLRGGGID